MFIISRRYYKNLCSLILLNVSFASIAMQFVPDEVNFADYHYVGTHNSHVYKRFFKTTYQHETDITDQLNNGVRGFMLDIYRWNEGEMNPTLIKTNRRVGPGENFVMSHAKPGFTAFTQKSFTGWDGILAIVEYQTYHYELERIINFLKNNPNEIIVIHMEDHIGINELARTTQNTISAIGYDPLFRPTDWNTKQTTPDTWPTLGWMRKNNKRLLITSDNPGSETLNNQTPIWDVRNFASNVWGAINSCSHPIASGCNPEKMCKPYHKFPHATVSFFNHFRSDALTWALWDVERDSRYDVLLDAYNKCKGSLFDGRKPNGIFTDRTVEAIRSLKQKGAKTIMDLVNEWNAEAANLASKK